MPSSSNKIITLTQMLEIRKSLSRQGRKLVFTNGCFDILHLGHVQYLEQAKGLGNVLVVGLNSDLSVRRLKGPKRPIMSEADRAGILAGLSSVDYVVVFDDDTAESLVAALRPDIYVKGGDYSQGRDLPEGRIVEGYGGKVVLLPFLAGRSTTDVIQTIVDRYDAGKEK